MDEDRSGLKISNDILDRVVYGMENQKEHLVLDPATGLLRPHIPDDHTGIPLPKWSSSDGYRLMDAYVGSLPASPLREALADILNSGTGVFRRFKDALHERPEFENLWIRFKKREMRRRALSWMNRWKDAMELEELGPEPEEWDDLTPTDFTYRNCRPGEQALLEEWDRTAGEQGAGIRARAAGDRVSGTGEPAQVSADPLRVGDAGEVHRIVAEGPSGDPVGCIRFRIDAAGEACVETVYVLPDFRGLGIGSGLIDAALRALAHRSVQSVSIRTGDTGGVLDDYLKRTGFRPVMTIWRLKTNTGGTAGNLPDPLI